MLISSLSFAKRLKTLSTQTSLKKDLKMVLLNYARINSGLINDIKIVNYSMVFMITFEVKFANWQSE